MRAMRLLPILSCCLAVGCTAQDPTPERVHERLYAMGTWVDVTLVSPDMAVADAALTEIRQMLHAFERDYYPWTPGALADLNATLATGRYAEVDARQLALLQRAKTISAASDGYFDPGIGALTELWGFHSTLSAHRDPPTDSAIDAVLEASGGVAALQITDGRVRATSRALKIDLGGIAKGAAIEQTLGILEQYGIENALVNAGGDLAAIGVAPGNRAWRVGIRRSRTDGVLGVIALREHEAAFTSGDYERFYEQDGQRYHHLLDPGTGRPATHTQALTVLSDDPVLADAAATALFVAGPGRWRTIAERLGVRAVLRVDADGTIEMTAAMRTRIQPAAPNHDIIAGSSDE